MTTNLNITYLRPALPNSGRLVCEGHVVHIGRRLAHAEATITDPSGEVYATATATCLITHQTAPSDRT